MAGDWIKMRGALISSPKLIAMTRELEGNREFRDWLTPGGGGEFNGQIVSHAASRYVTLSALLLVWSSSREHGRFVGEDLILDRLDIADLDEMASVPGIGMAMEAVGWAIRNKDQSCVTLPNFKQFNAPRTDAERQAAHRKRASQAVTEPSRDKRDNRVTREEKRREDIFSSPEKTEKRRAAHNSDTDDNWISSLIADPTYAHISDVRHELGKAKRWCIEHRRKCTRKMFVNWLNKIDRPITGNVLPMPAANGNGARFLTASEVTAANVRKVLAEAEEEERAAHAGK